MKVITLTEELTSNDYSKETVLYLHNKNLCGEIPDSISSLSNLQVLHLHLNQLSGEIPSSFSLLTNLLHLDLDNNKLTGEIPSCLSTLTNLRKLSLYNNQLSGEIPESLSTLTNLQYLWLHNNYFTKKPTWLSTMKIPDLNLENAFQVLPNELQSKQVNKESSLNHPIKEDIGQILYKQLKFREWIKKNEDKLIVNHFKDITFLGQGCNGLVMKCTISIEGENYIVALKMISNINNDMTYEFIKGTCNEYRILSMLSQFHDNVVHIIGEFVAKPTIEMINHIDESIRYLCYRSNNRLKSAQFFILQYYERNLASIIDNLSEDKILKYIKDLADGLLYLYDSKIVHLDIKRDNLMINIDDNLVIVDFGEAGICSKDYIVEYSQTQGGNVNHLAPEVINAKLSKQNLPCEKQYSWELGMILYEMLSGGDYPFDIYAIKKIDKLPPLDLEDIPQKYHNLLSELLCLQEIRLTILDAWYKIQNIH